MKKPRFTLTELLVGISTIAILAGVALPVYLKVRELGRSTHDILRLKQLGFGADAYALDHKGMTFSNATEGGWPSVLHNYVPAWKTFKSRFDPRPDGPPTASGEGVPVSFGINANILARPSSGANAFDGDVNKLTSPDKLIYMAPNVDLTQTTLTFIPATGNSNVALNPPTRVPAIRSDDRGTHAGRSLTSAVFADQHAANILYRDYATTSSADGSGQARWQPIHPK